MNFELHLTKSTEKDLTKLRGWPKKPSGKFWRSSKTHIWAIS